MKTEIERRRNQKHTGKEAKALVAVAVQSLQTIRGEGNAKGLVGLRSSRGRGHKGEYIEEEADTEEHSEIEAVPSTSTEVK